MTNDEIQVGRAPTPDEEFYYNWGQETLKQNLTLSNNILSNILVLSSALLGGIIFLMGEDLLFAKLKLLIAFAFLLSLIIAFIGILPFESKVDDRIPFDIKAHKSKALSSKRRYVWLAGSCMIAGFFIALGGIFAKLIM